MEPFEVSEGSDFRRQGDELVVVDMESAEAAEVSDFLRQEDKQVTVEIELSEAFYHDAVKPAHSWAGCKVRPVCR